MIEKLQYITHEIEGLSHWEQAEQVCLGGCKWIQLRVKNKNYDEIKKIALKVQKVCIKNGAKFIINDNVSLAHELLADGVHLGKSDMSPTDARKKLGDNFIIGGTANTFEDIKNLSLQEVDYIGLGPYRFTLTKENLSATLGIKGYKNILAKCKNEGINIPIIAIGGITIEDIPLLSPTGIHGIALSSSIHNDNNIAETTQKFLLTLYF